MQRISGLLKNFMRSYNYNPTDQVAVGVSGGCDSLALALATQTYFDPNSIHILTVDHRFRSESTAEANHVKQILEKHKFNTHKILTIKWHHDEVPPINKFEVIARGARYELLLSYCQMNKIKILLTAHHHLDRLETCLHRFTMGSSLDGLHGIQPHMVFNSHPGVTILRPFLREKKKDFQLICKENALEWVTDPTNYSPIFNRSCLRHVLSHNKALAEDLSEVVDFTNAFCEEADSQVRDFLYKYSVLDPNIGLYWLKWSKFLELTRPIAIRVLTRFMNFFTKDTPGQRRNFTSQSSSKAYNKLIYRKGKHPYVKATLLHYLIATAIPDEDRLYIGKCHAPEKLQIKVGETLTWDNRFLITLTQRDLNAPANENFIIRGMERPDQTFLFRAIRRVKAAKLPLIHYRLSLPIVCVDNGQIAFMPHFGYKDFDLNVDCSCKFIPHPSSIHQIQPKTQKRKRIYSPEL